MRKRLLRALLLTAAALLFTHTVPAARAASARSFPETAFVYPVYSVRTEVNGVRHQMQGACTDGRYIWGGWNNRRIITRLDITTMELQTREFTEEEWVCGHINDMAYNPNTNLLYVVGYDPNDFSTRGNIVMFDPITLEYRGMIRLRHDGEMIPINSMVYDRRNDRYIVSLAGKAGKDNVILDADFRYVGPLTLERAETLTLQGFDTGNFMTDEKGDPLLIDPAVYVGCNEADIAMTELFGGFDRRFYESYFSVIDKVPGYSDRKDLYNLYHLTNHLNLFGSTYLSAVVRTIERYQ